MVGFFRTKEIIIIIFFFFSVIGKDKGDHQRASGHLAHLLRVFHLV